MNELRLENMEALRFDEHGLIPVVTQAQDTRAVLMLAYADRQALNLTMTTGYAHYFSRSRQQLWRKGETSGHTQQVSEIRFDCDGDALLYIVRQEGPACHTGTYSCFGEDLKTDPSDPLTALQVTVEERRAHPVENSYTRYLFEKGLDKILKKVGEETAEVIIAAKNPGTDELRYETADLLYHISVLLTERGLAWKDVYEELEKRRKA